MSELPDPIREVLDDTVDEARVRRMWQGIEARQAPRGAPRWASGPRIAAAGALALAAAALIALYARPWADEAPASDAPDGPPAPLTAEGGPLATLTATERPRVIRFSDRSTITLDPDSRLEPLRNEGGVVSFLLASGQARFEVTPRGPRTWTVETGLATVEVVGTVFTVARGPDWAEVEVERGVVVVRGERVPDRAARLTAGDSLRVEDGEAVADGTPRGETPDRAPEDEAPLEAPDEAPVEPAMARHTARPRASEEPAVATPAPLGAEALMEQADAARREGRNGDAVALLERAAALDEPASGLAAFTLGRLQLDSLGQPAAAARAFGRALALRLPARLAEDASARLVEAHARAGDAAAARRAAEHYLARYPEGRHRERVRAALAGL